MIEVVAENTGDSEDATKSYPLLRYNYPIIHEIIKINKIRLSHRTFSSPPYTSASKILRGSDRVATPPRVPQTIDLVDAADFGRIPLKVQKNNRREQQKQSRVFPQPTKTSTHLCRLGSTPNHPFRTNRRFKG